MLLWDRGDLHAGPWYNTQLEAEDELLRWNRITGKDNHPVYALGVVRYYPNAKRKVSRGEMKRCIERMLAKQQADRLLLAQMLDDAKKLTG